MFKKNSQIIFSTLLLLTVALATHRSERFARMDHKQNFELLSNFTCAVAHDEINKHHEMRTIALVELENNFPSNFSQSILKCLPNFISKVVLNPHNHFDFNSTFTLPKESMVIYIADKIEKVGKLLLNLILLKKTFIGRNFSASA